MPSLFSVEAIMALLAVGAIAQDSPVKLCNAETCDYCPSSITTTGTGYPSCVIYDRETVLGGKSGDYSPQTGDHREIFFDIAPTQGDCKTIIRTPASTTDPNCGFPVYGGQGGTCLKVDTKATFMVQFCCGTGDCGAAGVSKRSGTLFGDMSSMVLRDADGNVIVPHSVGDASSDKFDTFLEDHGVNSSAAIQARSASGVPVFKIGYDAPVEKRDCDTFIEDGAPYTKTGTSSMQVSGYICGDGSSVTIMNSNSVSRTTTFSSSVGDPFGVVSASVGFSTEKSASQSKSYMFTPGDGQCGHLTFTPFFNCVGGKITGCDGGDQNGEVCTAKRVSDKEIDGAYFFTQS